MNAASPSRKPPEVPPNCRPGRRVSITLTVGQENAIRNHVLFELCGGRFSEVIRHFIRDGCTKRAQP